MHASRRFIFFAIGSWAEREASEFANKFSTRKEYDIYRADKEDVTFRLEVVDDISMGDSFEVKVVAANTSDFFRTVRVNITSIMAFYTGITAKPLKQKKETLRLEGMSGTDSPLYYDREFRYCNLGSEWFLKLKKLIAVYMIATQYSKCRETR